MTRRLVYVFVLAWLVVGLVPEVTAREATAREVADLASAAAAGDPSALRSLRAIDRVEDREVDLASALEAEGEDLASRLQALARPPDVDVREDARAIAEDVLAQRRYQDTDLPQPLRGPLEALADRLRELGGPLSSLIDAIPGEGSVQWIVLAVFVAALSTLVALRLARRRARLQSRQTPYFPGPRRTDPRALEAAAEKAELEGDLERALRLRFAAGLARLDQRRTIEFSPSITTGELARRLASPDFDKVATIFDEVVYGQRPATGSDVSATRDGWERVLVGSGGTTPAPPGRSR